MVLGQPGEINTMMTFTEETTIILETAREIAEKMGHDRITTAHLLIAVLEHDDPESLVFKLFRGSGQTFDTSKLRAEVKKLVK